MGNKYKILSLLLALMLVGSNLVFSGHTASHAATDFEFCALCIHAGTPDNAITAETATPVIVPATFIHSRDDTPAHHPTSILYDHQSRAPPEVT